MNDRLLEVRGDRRAHCECVIEQAVHFTFRNLVRWAHPPGTRAPRTEDGKGSELLAAAGRRANELALLGLTIGWDVHPVFLFKEKARAYFRIECASLSNEQHAIIITSI